MTTASSLLTATTARLRAAGCVFAEEEARLLVAEAATSAELGAMVERRVSGVPLEQVVGWAEFCGLRIAVTPGVFVPRRRTELLVREAERLALDAERPGRDAKRPLVVVDLCCGSGAVGAALAARLCGSGLPVELHAVDVDPAAVACARRNLPEGAEVHQGDLFEPLPDSLRSRVDLLVANAPYVPSNEIALMPPEAREHEARVALDGGADGLDVQRRVVAGAPSWLAPGGHLLVETSDLQAPRTLAAVARIGLLPRDSRDEELGATVVVGSEQHQVRVLRTK
jgi:release factor glutamine methyltransferase